MDVKGGRAGEVEGRQMKRKEVRREKKEKSEKIIKKMIEVKEGKQKEFWVKFDYIKS